MIKYDDINKLSICLENVFLIDGHLRGTISKDHKITKEVFELSNSISEMIEDFEKRVNR